ncbi:Condensin complex subunit 3-like protein [Drosera capensis]
MEKIFSIKHRTVILQRGLSDRSPTVVKECLKLMKDEWLAKHCKSDPIELLKFLDVETYETIGDSVMGALLCAGVIDLHDGQSACRFMGLTSTEAVGDGCASSQLLDPEIALYWSGNITNLQAKGSDAASTTGTEAAIYAAEASDNNDLLEKFLPATVSQYVELAKGLLAAGPNYRFTSRQLLLLGAMLDFSDATNRRVAGAFVQDLLMRPLEYELDHDGNMIVIGDGINLGGDKDWAFAVSELAKKVHASGGEFEEVLLGVIGELAQSCRERTADCIQWMHCLAVTGLLLENVKSFHQLQGKAIEPAELLHSLLLPGAKHLNLDVQRVAVQCLGLYGLLERRPSEEILKQLRVSFVKGPCPISFLAGKALMDLVMWHGPQEVDKSYGLNSPLLDENVVASVASIDFSSTSGDLDSGVLDLLHAALANENWNQLENFEEDELVQAVLGEGFAKILLLSDKYPSINCSLHTSVLVKLIALYFIEETKELNRLKQCLSVFFEHYPSLSTSHKKHLSQAFIPVVGSMWPGINGNPKESSVTVSNMRKRAVQASLFMMQMMQAPLYAKVTGNSVTNLPETEDGSVENIDDFENGEEGLAIRIAAEMASFPVKKTQAEKSYVSALCKSLVQLRFRPSEQGAIKLMRYLLNRLANTLSFERELVKEFKNMAEYLRKMDGQPDQEILPDQADIIFRRLGLKNPGPDNSMEVPPTPAPRSTRSARPRRRRHEETSSDEERSPPQIIMPAAVVGLSSGRSQRASKLAALSKLATHRTAVAHDHIDEEEEGSDLTSEDESAELD